MKTQFFTRELASPSPQQRKLAGVRLSSNWRGSLRHYVFLLPFFVLFAMFFLWPVLYALGMSFTDWDGIDPAQFIGMQNYLTVARSAPFIQAFRNQFLFVLFDVPIGILLAFGIALLVNSFTGRLGNFFRILYFLPTIIPLFLTATIWAWMLSPFGIVTVLLHDVGLQIDWTDPSTAIARLVLVDVWRSAGFNMIILLAGLKNIPQEYYEAARIDGANAWQRLRSITLPQIEPILFLVTVIAVINTFQIFDLPWLFSQSTFTNYGGNFGEFLFPTVDMLGRAIGQLQFGAASAYAIMLLALILLVTLVQFALRKRQY